MTAQFLPTTPAIKELFAQQVTEAGGTVSDSYDDGQRLFLRAILPRMLEVRVNDSVQGGVALRTVGEQVVVQPYVFRRVCRNGAIMAQTLDTCSVQRVDEEAPEDDVAAVQAQLVLAIGACCAEDVFAGNVNLMRAATDSQGDMILTLMPLFSKFPHDQAARLLSDIVERFSGGRDSSRYGLMNAVTSLARDTRDPVVRWRLEEMGGAVAAALSPVPKPDNAAAMCLTA